MNPQLLQKCVDELGKETPRLDYVRGILETLIDIQPSSPTSTVEIKPKLPSIIKSENTSEADILDGLAKAGLSKIQKNPLE